MAKQDINEQTEHPEDQNDNSLVLRKQDMEADLDDPVTLVERVYQIWWRWADFHIFIISPSIPKISPPVIIKPEVIPGTHELEHVYDIHDFGSKLSTSKGEELLNAGMSMCKLYMTIEKMIYIIVERLKTGGVDTETEVQVAFGGHLLPQRKAFESIINLAYNVVVTNFDPGVWGERYLQIVKQNAEKFGYPPEAPRSTFKQPHQSVSARVK
jgi:hypothetical protein